MKYIIPDIKVISVNASDIIKTSGEPEFTPANISEATVGQSDTSVVKWFWD